MFVAESSVNVACILISSLDALCASPREEGLYYLYLLEISNWKPIKNVLVQISECPEKSRHYSRVIKQVNVIIKDLDFSSPPLDWKVISNDKQGYMLPFLHVEGSKIHLVLSTGKKVLPQSDCIKGAHKLWNDWLSSRFLKQSLAKGVGFYDWIQQIRVHLGAEFKLR